MKLKKKLKLLSDYELNYTILDKKNNLIQLNWGDRYYDVFVMTYAEMEDSFGRAFVQENPFSDYIDVLKKFEADNGIIEELSLIPDLLCYSPDEDTETMNDILYKRGVQRFKNIEDELFNNECISINGDITLNEDGLHLYLFKA